MKHVFHAGIAAIALCPILQSCIDNDYDLSDIDTTTEIKVTDLVIPMNMDEVKLGDIIEIDDESKIKELSAPGLGSFYAVTESGTFSSNSIEIPSFSSAKPNINSTTLSFGNPAYQVSTPISCPLPEPIRRSVAFSASNVDKSIVTISEIGLRDFVISLDFTADVTNVTAEMADIEMTVPSGLKIESLAPAGNYNVETGKLTIPSLQFNAGKAKLILVASKLALPADAYNATSHTFSFNSVIDIESANLNIRPASSGSYPAGATIKISYDVAPIKVSTFSGRVKYMLEGNGLDIPPIQLDNLPDFLSGDDTNLILDNPQIYLRLNNPIANEKLSYRTGVQLTAQRPDGPKTFSLDNGFFSVGFDKGVTGPYNICISPKGPQFIPQGYENPSDILFSSLGRILSGKGIPSQIEIELVEPQIPEQEVMDFTLGQTLPALSGKWDFIAPLSMVNSSEGESSIVYTDRKDGWGNEDVSAMTITTFTVTCTVDNGLPFDAVLSAKPVDSKGNLINADIKSSPISANTNGQAVEITMTGKVTDLDGIEFQAAVKPVNGVLLSPDQTITLKNIRGKVSGHYTKKF